jgi:GT2 family glycosyltransferase
MSEHVKISVVIPSAPERSFESVLQNLEKVRPKNAVFEVFIIKGTWPPVQRNMGIKAATGEYIFLFDDDVVIPRGSIEKALETFGHNPDVQVVGGPNLTPPENDYIQHCFGFAHASPFVGLQTSARYRPARSIRRATEKHLISCNLAFRSKALKENPFDTKIFPNEENELLGRMSGKGLLLAYNPDFFVYHHRRKKLTQYIRQIFNWGRGRTIHSIKRPDNFDPLFFIPLLFVIYLLSLLWIQNVWYLLPLAAYVILDLAFVIENGILFKKWSSVAVMFWLFPLTHITYGTGLLAGLLSFWGHEEKKVPEEKEFLLIKVDIA